MTQRVQGFGGGGQWKRFTQAAIGGMAYTGNLGGQLTDIVAQDAFVPIGNLVPAHPLFNLDPSVFFEIVLVPGGSPNETQFQRLRYIGSASGLCALVTCSLSIQDPTLGAIGIAAKLQKNGVDIPDSEQEGQTGGLVTTAGSTTIQGSTILEPGDDLRVLVANASNDNDFIVSSCHLTALGL
jgi:hypothetical protein